MNADSEGGFMKSVAVVVTTEHRGVFFGYGNTKMSADRMIKLTSVRMCIYWSQDVKGVLGLASGGPTKDCRVGPAVPEIELSQVTSIMICTYKAAKAWEEAPWRL